MAATISASSTTVRCASVSIPKVSLRTSNAVSVSFGGFSQRSNNRCLRITCEAKPDTVEKVIEIVTKQLAVKEGSVKPNSKFQELGADSLDQVEIVMALEEEFNISVDESGAESIVTVEDAAKLIEETLAKC